MRRVGFTVLTLTLLWISTYCSKKFVGFKEKKTYSGAKAACESLPGKLATWSSRDEFDYEIIAAERRIPAGQVWVGLDDIRVEGTWTFIDGDNDYCGGSNCRSLTEWTPGQPNGDRSTPLDCAMLQGRGLVDVPCNYQYPYICEILSDSCESDDCDYGSAIATLSGRIDNIKDYGSAIATLSGRIDNIKDYGGAIDTLRADINKGLNDVNKRIDTLRTDVNQLIDTLRTFFTKKQNFINSLEDSTAAHTFVGDTISDSNSVFGDSLISFVSSNIEFLFMLCINILTVVIGLFICWKGGLFSKNKVQQYSKVIRSNEAEDAEKKPIYA